MLSEPTWGPEFVRNLTRERDAARAAVRKYTVALLTAVNERDAARADAERLAAGLRVALNCETWEGEPSLVPLTNESTTAMWGALDAHDAFTARQEVKR